MGAPAREAEAVFADASSGMRAWLCTMMNLPPGSVPLGSLTSRSEVVGAPHAGLLREQMDVGGVAGVPFDVIVEQVALQLGDAGVERILGPRHAERPARLPATARPWRPAAPLREVLRASAPASLPCSRLGVTDEAVALGVVRRADDHRRRCATNRDAAWAPSATGRGRSCDERRRIEVADAADVRIEGQIAAEAQQRRHLAA